MPRRPPVKPKTPTVREPIDSSRLPEKARLQVFLYHRKRRQYVAAAKGWHRVIIFRSPREAEQFWKELERLCEETHRWQE